VTFREKGFRIRFTLKGMEKKNGGTASRGCMPGQILQRYNHSEVPRGLGNGTQIFFRTAISNRSAMSQFTQPALEMEPEALDGMAQMFGFGG
jgi:hypothetical protein